MTRTTTAAALTCAALLAAAGAARADTTYVVDSVKVTGNKSVPTEQLMSVIQEHKGSRVTQSDIIADQTLLTQALGKANVGGSIKTLMAAKSNKHIDVTFAIQDQGVQTATVSHVAPVLHAQIFEGNKSLATDKLVAASGLAAGDKLSDQKVADAQKAIIAAYKDAKLPVNVNLSGSTQAVAGGRVDVTWHVTETKAKRKSRDTEDQREQLEQ